MGELGDSIYQATGGRRYYFVIMTWHGSFPFFERIRAIVAEATGFECIRADDIPPLGDLRAKIHSAIDQAALVIADISEKSPKADNIAAARRIPIVLGLIGLQVVLKSRKHLYSDAQVREIIEDNIETVAEAEHRGWMENKRRGGWVLGKPRCDTDRVHDAMVEYKHLSEENEARRDSVRACPAMSLAGFASTRADPGIVERGVSNRSSRLS